MFNSSRYDCKKIITEYISCPYYTHNEVNRFTITCHTFCQVKFRVKTTVSKVKKIIEGKKKETENLFGMWIFNFYSNNYITVHCKIHHLFDGYRNLSKITSWLLEASTAISNESIMIENLWLKKTHIRSNLNITELTERIWVGVLRTFILPPLPSAPTAIKSPLLDLFADDDSLFCPRLHHFPKNRWVPSGPSNPPEKQILSGSYDGERSISQHFRFVE